MPDVNEKLCRLDVDGRSYRFANISSLRSVPDQAIDQLPRSLKSLLENLLRHADREDVSDEDIEALLRWPHTRRSSRVIPFFPARILMPDSSGIPLLADLAAMREAAVKLGADPDVINSTIPVDLVVDHAVTTQFTGPHALQRNLALEFKQNDERYRFLRWAQDAFRNFRVIPPGKGILHQINLEFLGKPVRSERIEGEGWAYLDSLVGTDSHTPMINALGIVGWGVGGIEASSAMLGEPIQLPIPDVIGCRLTGRLKAGVSSMDLALTVTERLRKKGVVGKVVEFFGPGMQTLPVTDRATIANMAPEYGATMGFFPINAGTLAYLRATGRDEASVALVEAYAKAQGLWAEDDSGIAYTDELNIDLDEIELVMAGPSRPEDRHVLSRVSDSFKAAFPSIAGKSRPDSAPPSLRDGDAVIAAITSCTTTSNPAAMIAAGLLARNAEKLGLRPKSWVKMSLSPGSRVVVDYLSSAELLPSLEAMGFAVTGFGCMTCGGTSGDLLPGLEETILREGLTVTAVLSANRNFEGRTHPSVKATYLGSPALVVAYALAGSILHDFDSQSLRSERQGKPVFLRDIWPDPDEIDRIMRRHVDAELFSKRYADIFVGPKAWQALPPGHGRNFAWDPNSTYFRRPPYFDDIPSSGSLDVVGARPLLVLGDSVTTDHISPCGPVAEGTPAGDFLWERGVRPEDFHNFEARRVNHEVMTRGGFSNIRLRNEMTPGAPGGMTRHMPDGDILPTFDAAQRYRAENVPLVIVAGARYGAGSSRDWAAKATALLGVRAVIAESFERIHRSNLVGMGVLPLEFTQGQDRATLGIVGDELFDLAGVDRAIDGEGEVLCNIRRRGGAVTAISLNCIVTRKEAIWLRKGGVLHHLLSRVPAVAELRSSAPHA